MTPRSPDPFARAASISLGQALARLGEAVRQGRAPSGSPKGVGRRLPFRRDIDG
jgi:hypothetical protein